MSERRASLPRGGLEVRGLRIAGEVELVHGVEVSLAPGGALGIVGESGSQDPHAARILDSAAGLRRTDREVTSADEWR